MMAGRKSFGRHGSLASIRRRCLIATIAAIGGVFCCTSCRHVAPIIAVIPRTTGTLLWEPMHLGVAEAARDNGAHIYWNAPADEVDLEGQLAQLDRCIRNRYTGIVFVPDQTMASRSLVLEAIHRGIPLVVVDDDLGPAAGPLLSYVSNDEAKGARMAAERVAKILNGHGAIAIVGMYTQSESGISREEYFERDLAELAPSITIFQRRFGDANVTHEQEVTQEILQTNKVNAIVAMTGASTRGAYYARLASKSQIKVPIVGFDQDMLMPLRNGNIDAVVAQDTRRIGEVAIGNIEGELQGRYVQPITLVSPLLITRDKLDSGEVSRLWKYNAYRWDQQ